jgi:UDP-N-acetylmuramate--alanine ligase
MLDKVRHIYFLGIGGIGMSALARYFHVQGKIVSGYDKVDTHITKSLQNEGINIHFDDRGEKALEDVDLLIYTPAIPHNLNEYIAFMNSDIPKYKRAEILGEISKDYFTIAIAGTHGKTTITSMVAHILHDCGVKLNAFIGGISNNYNSNLIVDAEAKLMVVEADEFDRSFLHLHPDIAIISSMDADHLDIYNDKSSLENTFMDFARQIKKDGFLIHHENLNIPSDIADFVFTYGERDDAVFQSELLKIENKSQVFSFKDRSGNKEIYELPMPGRHNLNNITAALAVATFLYIHPIDAALSLKKYKGVRRRFERIIDTDNQVLIDDYAHHPEEIKAAIAATREMYPDKKVMGIFQPHLYTRTRDFANEFAAELSKLDSLVLLEIYPARELPIEGVDSQMLLNKVQLDNKQIVSKENLPTFIINNPSPVILIMGAGDIDRQVDIVKQTLLNA